MSKAHGQMRIYRALLRLYPSSYRTDYGEQMVQLFGDQVRDEGALRTWLKAATDLPKSAVSERMRRNRTVAQTLTLAPTPLSRVLGVLGVVGGAALLIGFLPAAFAQLSTDQFNLRLILYCLGAIAVVLAVYARQSAAGQRIALAGAIPAVIANAAYIVVLVRVVAQPGDIGAGDYGPWFGYLAGAMWLSDMWFGLVTFKLGVLRRWSAAALVVGSFAAFAGSGVFGPIVFDSLYDKAILAGIFLQGIAWALLGLEVALRRRSIPAAAEKI